MFPRFVQCDYVLLGLLVYQMATGNRPYGDIHSLEMLVIATLAGKVNLNVEAEHFLRNQQVRLLSTVFSTSIGKWHIVINELLYNNCCIVGHQLT